eukprot:CAMPEP_0174283124 /NCGR_PEP_ID=MMETSP0809-20121228/3740_1 /TAXON_ID=73025 ORGANISM="Eutreptiella gymnastica-like, Strain CCMP1594" /NCGR_SAMPLE_ID=MMETSP0809 /ASSEMBLY_ACC=CAM_ASM_000658 /LENGTH=336 /DNA_ID=CAMNT_0015377809 /DNA_START=50 /DNA_END=1060 /DNA_ORIENTATION=+
MESAALTKDHMAAGLSSLGRTGSGLSTAFLKADLANLLVSDVSILTDYAALQDVDLHNNRLTDLTPLKNIRYLLKLDVSKNAISAPECLEVLPTPAPLLKLNLSSNSFRVVPEMAHLQMLTELCLDHNSLPSLDGVENLPSLTALSARHNLLHGVEALARSSASLKRLHLDNNDIHVLEPIQGLRESLLELTVSANEIMHIQALAQFRCLLKLDIAANNIHEPRVLADLCGVASLAHLSVSDNPMCYPKATALIVADERKLIGDEVAPDTPSDRQRGPAAAPSSAEPPDPVVHQQHLRQRVLAALPQLQTLDGQAVSAEDKVRAKMSAAGSKGLAP